MVIVAPATPADAKGLLIASIENDNPILFLEHKALYRVKGDVPEGHYSDAAAQGCDRPPGQGRDRRRDDEDGARGARRGQ